MGRFRLRPFWLYFIISLMGRSKDYDKRIFRLLSILNKLDKGYKISSRQLAEDFNVSIRTIQRDLEVLNQAGFLLTSLQKGLYKFEDGFSLSKVKITGEEACLLSFLYDIVKSLGEKFEKSYRRILKKILQEEYDSPFYVKIPQGVGLKNYPFVSELEEAIDQNQKIKIKYEKDKETKTYKICPLKIIFYGGFWYLLGQIDKKDWLNKFRVEKIKELEVLDEYFLPPSNLMAILDKSVNIWFSEKETKRVLLKVDGKVSKFFKEKVYFPNQKIKKEYKDKSLLIESRVSDYMEVIPSVLYWIPYVTVIDPKEIKRELKKMVNNYIKKC